MLSLLLSVTAPSNSACRRLVCLCEPQSRYLGLTAHVPEEGTGLWGLLSGEPREHGQQPTDFLLGPAVIRVLPPCLHVHVCYHARVVEMRGGGRMWGVLRSASACLGSFCVLACDCVLQAGAPA